MLPWSPQVFLLALLSASGSDLPLQFEMRNSVLNSRNSSQLGAREPEQTLSAGPKVVPSVLRTGPESIHNCFLQWTPRPTTHLGESTDWCPLSTLGSWHFWHRLPGPSASLTMVVRSSKCVLGVESDVGQVSLGNSQKSPWLARFFCQSAMKTPCVDQPPGPMALQSELPHQQISVYTGLVHSQVVVICLQSQPALWSCVHLNFRFQSRSFPRQGSASSCFSALV
ncbi:hypothetical protein BGZ60DRAFT_399155 [Tricladium varicosporioides]|nr:hypothetical protein BGZ60DRAFT_399155 [Hymenoscyphus varicosporioides]